MKTLKTTAHWFFLALALLAAVFPFYWMLRTSVSSNDTVFEESFNLLPSSIDLSGYQRAWETGGLGHAMVIGALVTLGILILQLITCIPAAYVLATHRAKWTGAVFTFVMLCLLIPSQVIMIPLFIGFNQIGLGDTILSLILPFATSVLGTFMLRNQMMSIPSALLEAATMDGLGPVKTLVKVIIPMSMPGVAAFSIYSIFVHWNDYMWPLLVARSPELRTPPLALAIFQDSAVGYDYPALAAGATIVTIPILLIFLLGQKHFVRGMSGTEVTG